MTVSDLITNRIDIVVGDSVPPNTIIVEQGDRELCRVTNVLFETMNPLWAHERESNLYWKDRE